MKKTSRSTNCGAKGSAQSSMNPYHKMRCGYASGGSIPGSDVSNATNGQSKKANTPGEEVFRGKSISKNFAKGGNVPKRGGGGILGDLLGLFGLAEGGQVPKRGGGGILGDLLGIFGLDEGGQVPKSSGCRLRTGLRDILPEQKAKGGKCIQNVRKISARKLANNPKIKSFHNRKI